MKASNPVTPSRDHFRLARWLGKIRTMPIRLLVEATFPVGPSCRAARISWWRGSAALLRRGVAPLLSFLLSLAIGASGLAAQAAAAADGGASESVQSRQLRGRVVCLAEEM